MDLMIDLRAGSPSSQPCPNSSSPLHHFMHQPYLSRPRPYGILAPDPKTGFAWVDEQHFQCSATECGAKVVIWFKPPRFTEDWVKQLTDRFMIQTRAEKAIAEDPKRFEGHAVPLPINVLTNLRTYVSNAAQASGKVRKILGHNKQFLLSLGESCCDILEYAGFRRDVSKNGTHGCARINRVVVGRRLAATGA